MKKGILFILLITAIFSNLISQDYDHNCSLGEINGSELKIAKERKYLLNNFIYLSVITADSIGVLNGNGFGRYQSFDSIPITDENISVNFFRDQKQSHSKFYFMHCESKISHPTKTQFTIYQLNYSNIKLSICGNYKNLEKCYTSSSNVVELYHFYNLLCYKYGL